jgi:hypothetical protein
MWRTVLPAVAGFFFADCPAVAAEPAPVAAIPYRLDGKLLDFQVSINGYAPVWFCLDSGAPHSVIDPRLAKILGLTVTPGGSVTGTGAGAVATGHVGPVTMTLAGAPPIPVADPWVIDLSGVPFAKDTLGLVGHELFANYVVRLDPLHGTLYLFDPKTFAQGPGGTTLPLIVENGKLFLEVGLDVNPQLRVRHKLRIDTGSEESVNDPIVAQARETRVTTLGQGLGQDFQAVSGVFDAVHVGPYTIRHVWGPGAPTPAIGMEIFRRFVTTFDVTRGTLHLAPTPALTEPVPPPS